MKANLEEVIDTVKKLSEFQLDNLKEYIEYHFTTQKVDKGIYESKKEIYSFYKHRISPLVNKIEVYKHDFPFDAYSGIETIFRCMSSIEKENKEDAIKLYKDLLNYSIDLESQLSIELIKFYVERIKSYKKTLTKFNYKGVDKDFKKNINKSLCMIKENLKKGTKLFRERKKSYSNKQYFHYGVEEDNSKEYNFLSNALKEAESIVDYCEIKYPKIIRSGYSNKLWVSLFPIVSILLTIAFSVWGVIGLIKLI